MLLIAKAITILCAQFFIAVDLQL